MSSWKTWSVARRVLFVVTMVALLVSVLSAVAALIWGTPFWPFSLLGSTALIVNGVVTMRDWLRSPIPGRDASGAKLNE
jgi:hypothetical protein